jgi:hypothetical protein
MAQLRATLQQLHSDQDVDELMQFHRSIRGDYA